ncbi:MAG: hypothetical protein HY337_04295 [Gemmatimonadetes bacterium]|jgi:hypothetical protein|nr:hypothetical protein [Gemmatimonadota bacterium]
MSEPFYIARASVEKVLGTHRRAALPLGVFIDFGVHGAVKAHYRLTDARDLPLPVDYIVAATGA